MRMLYKEILAEQTYETYACAESPLFKKRVSEIMSSRVITCRTSDTVTDVAKIMDEKNISAVVVLDNEEKPRGLLTEKNLVRQLIANQMYSVSQCTVEKVMNSNLVKIGPEFFLGQALVAMIRRNARHLIVTERESLVGIITMIDLIRSRSTGNLLLSQDIESQTDLKGLSSLSREADNILDTLIAEKTAVHEIFEVMSELHERLSRRVIYLSEEKMKLTGWGPPPVEYCWINMGSGARYEQTLRTDQDNAIVYNDPEEENTEAVDKYFAKLSELIIEGFSKCGFVKCKGDVMATNPKWRRSLSAWISAIQNRSRSYDPEHIRMLTILLDYRPIWGNMSLAEKLWDEIFRASEACLT